MKIFHCADLHLESPFSALSALEALKRRRELCSVFVSITEYAKKEKVELFLIAGDLFDTFRISDETKNTVKEALSSLPCKVVISPGNHDKYIKGGFFSELDEFENIFVFKSDELGRFDFDDIGISVSGYAFTSDIYEKNPLSGDVCPSDSNINILCAHGDTLNVVNSQMAPLNVSEIAEKGFTYAALGHIHKPGEPKVVGGCTVAYSGFAQGRDFGECGLGSANLVEIDKNTKKVKIEKLSFSNTRYEIEKLDISGCEKDADVIKKIENTISTRSYDGTVCLRVILSGAVSRDYTPSCRRIEKHEGFSSLKLIEIKNETSPVLGLEEFERDLTLKGEFYRLLLPKLSSPSEKERKEALLALKMGLSALTGQDVGLTGREETGDEDN